MKLFLVNNYSYIICYDYANAERLYRERFNAYGANEIKSIELISDHVIMERGE